MKQIKPILIFYINTTFLDHEEREQFEKPLHPLRDDYHILIFEDVEVEEGKDIKVEVVAVKELKGAELESLVERLEKVKEESYQLGDHGQN